MLDPVSETLINLDEVYFLVKLDSMLEGIDRIDKYLQYRPILSKMSSILLEHTKNATEMSILYFTKDLTAKRSQMLNKNSDSY